MESRATQEAGICMAGPWGAQKLECVHILSETSREQLLPGLEENGHTRGHVVLRQMGSSGLLRWRDRTEHLSHSSETPERPHLRSKGHTLE